MKILLNANFLKNTESSNFKLQWIKNLRSKFPDFTIKNASLVYNILFEETDNFKNGFECLVDMKKLNFLYEIEKDIILDLPVIHYSFVNKSDNVFFIFGKNFDGNLEELNCMNEKEEEDIDNIEELKAKLTSLIPNEKMEEAELLISQIILKAAVNFFPK